MTTEALLSADFKTQPWKHQLREFEEAVEAPARALLWQMRSGKSKMMVDTACHLYRAGHIDGVLVVAPNGVHENWVVREVPTHSWEGVDWKAIAWITDVAGRTSGQRSKASTAAMEKWWADVKEAMKQPALLWIAVNSESCTRTDVRKLIATFAKKRRLLVIWDEASDFRTPGSKRTLMMRALAKRVPFRRILDGTLSHNSPLHVFSPFELLQEGALGFTRFSDFESRYAEYEQVKLKNGRKVDKLSHFKNLDELKQRMASLSSVVLRSDCEDLPTINARRVEVEMSPIQREIYDQMMARTAIAIEGKDVPISEQTMKLMKLQQITSGFLIDEYKEVHEISGRNPRLEALSDEVRRAPGKVIIWCSFQKEIDMVAARLRADGHKILEYHGRVRAADKLQARIDFQSDPEVKAIVGQPQAGGRGLDLSAADHVFFYSHQFNAIVREQAKERATKMAGSNIDLADFFVLGGPDYYIWQTTEAKVNVGDDVAGRGLKAVLQDLQR